MNEITEAMLDAFPVALHLGTVEGQIGEYDPSEEVALDWGFDTPAFVSGSWKCWGPADQATDGDDTLHVVIYLEALPNDLAVAFYQGSVESRLGLEVRRSYEVTESRDWSELVL